MPTAEEGGFLALYDTCPFKCRMVFGVLWVAGIGMGRVLNLRSADKFFRLHGSVSMFPGGLERKLSSDDLLLSCGILVDKQIL